MQFIILKPADIWHLQKFVQWTMQNITSHFTTDNYIPKKVRGRE